MRLSNLILALPHGVKGVSVDMPGLVESSCNLAKVNATSERAEVLLSLRSSVLVRFSEMIAQIRAIAAFADLSVQESKGYPAWTPNPESLLLKRALTVYSDLFEKEAKIQVIHAGLECAIIGGNYPGMEMISIGPTIRNPHSPDERLYIPSIDRVWRFLDRLLGTYCT